MEKRLKSQLSPEQQEYIKQMLDKDYRQTFENNGISSMKDTEICNLGEFLITMDYAHATRNETIYRNDENLQRIYVVKNKNHVDGKSNKAVLINTNPKGKEPQGEFGVYDFDKNEFQISAKVKDEIVKHLGIGALPIEKQDEMINELFTKKLNLNELSTMDQVATMDLTHMIDERVPQKEIEQLRDKYVDGQNQENGKTKKERDEIESQVNGKREQQVTIGQEKDGQADKNEVPDDVQKACTRMGVYQIRGFFYANAAELESKVDGTRTNKNGNKVLIIEVYDNRLGCNKYYGFQDDRMVLYGNDSEINKAVKDVTGNVTKMGKVIKPLRPQEDQFIEYEDSQGLVIREKIEDGQEMSMQEINRYREDMEDTLTKYSQKIFQIKNDPLLTDEQKIERIQAVDDWCDKTTTKITRENDGSLRNDQNIDNTTDKQTLKIQEEIADNQGSEIGE